MQHCVYSIARDRWPYFSHALFALADKSCILSLYMALKVPVFDGHGPGELMQVQRIFGDGIA